MTDNDIVQLCPRLGQYQRDFSLGRIETHPVRGGRNGGSVRSLIHGEDLGLVNPAYLKSDNGSCFNSRRVLFKVSTAHWTERSTKGTRKQENRGQTSNSDPLVRVAWVFKLLRDSSLPSQEDGHEDRSDDERLSSSKSIDCRQLTG